MDMLGYDSNDDGLCEIHTGGYFRTMADSMMKWNSQWNLNLTPTLYTGNATTHSDHASFWNYGYQALLLIENYAWDFNAYYHSTADIVNNMNLSYFHRMSQLAIGTAAALAGVSPETSVWDGKSLPGGFDLSDPYPNPFNPSTIIRFTIPGEIGTRLEIFDMRGRRVRTLLEERLTAGTHEVFWDGRDGGGGLLPSGVYLIRCRAGEQILQKKAALVK